MDRHVVSAGVWRELAYRHNPCAERPLRENGFCAREVIADVIGLLRRAPPERAKGVSEPFQFVLLRWTAGGTWLGLGGQRLLPVGVFWHMSLVCVPSDLHKPP